MQHTVRNVFFRICFQDSELWRFVLS
jgi:hypothetical protein